MSRRAFTVAELAISISILAIVVPLVFHTATGWEENHALALWHVQTADSLRTVTEELRLDAWGGEVLESGEGELRFERGDCIVRYAVDPAGTLVRRAVAPCDGTRALARGVSSLERVPGGVEIVFSRVLRPSRVHRSRVFVPLEGS